MRNRRLKQLLMLAIFFIAISLFRRWLNPSYLPFWVGGLIGAFLADLDFLIYAFLSEPYNQSSQQARQFFRKGSFFAALDHLEADRSQKDSFIFHSAFFQLLFLLFSFFVISSTASFLGRGIVLAFNLRLLSEQFLDINKTDGLASWFKQSPLQISLKKEQATLYWFFVLIAVFFLGFIF